MVRMTKARRTRCRILLTVAMIAGAWSIPARAANEPVDYVAGHPIYAKYDWENVEIVENEEPENMTEKRSLAIPARYDPRESGMVPAHVEDQGMTNTCWAFASISAMECNLIKNGYEDEYVNLSENFLAYFFYNRQTDPLNGTVGDRNIAVEDTWDQNGGSIQGTANFLTTWAGVIKDTESTGEVYVPEELPNENSYNTDYHVKSTYFYNYSVENVKNAILDHGAVVSGIYMMEEYWNFDKCSYYSPEAAGNHAVAIIGWDDSYSKENFNEEPQNDGAWIVRNSYGSGDFLGNGYLYVSYEDASLNEITAFELTGTSDDYAYNYQYDGSGNPVMFLNMDETNKIANTFVVKGTEEGCNEKLEAVSIGIFSTWTEYELEIYAGLTADAEPEEGTLVAAQTGVVKDAGNQRIELEQPVELMAGERYAVVFSFNSEDHAMVAMDSSLDEEWIAFENQVESGQSYCAENFVWEDLADLYEEEGLNFRIKAYTDATEQKTILALDKTSLLLRMGDTGELSAIFTPANLERDVRWNSDDENIAVVENGIVQAAGIGKTRIMASVGDMTASCEVTVYESSNAGEGGNTNGNGGGQGSSTTVEAKPQTKRELTNVSDVAKEVPQTGDYGAEKPFLTAVVAFCAFLCIRKRQQSAQTKHC